MASIFPTVSAFNRIFFHKTHSLFLFLPLRSWIIHFGSVSLGRCSVACFAFLLLDFFPLTFLPQLDRPVFQFLHFYLFF